MVATSGLALLLVLVVVYSTGTHWQGPLAVSESASRAGKLSILMVY
jgi:hypothetical protein